jgi:CDP-diacylglycerol--inositol 3-phosphatidyltransferase
LRDRGIQDNQDSGLRCSSPQNRPVDVRTDGLLQSENEVFCDGKPFFLDYKPTNRKPKMPNALEVLLYVPNLIGYARVLCTCTSLVLMIAFRELWLEAIILYLASFVGDLFDGLVARKLNQCSQFGGLLDMITDRLSTLGLLFVLSFDYQKSDAEIGFPVFRLLYLSLVILDISSHWCQMYSTATLGRHHKADKANEERNFLVKWFYKYYFFFGYLCVGAEFTYVIAYVLQFTENSWYHSVLETLFLVCLPGCVLKQMVNVFQLTSACYAVAQNDANKDNSKRK